MVMTSQAIVARSTRARKKVPVKNTLLQTLLLDNAECLLKNQSFSFEYRQLYTRGTVLLSNKIVNPMIILS